MTKEQFEHLIGQLYSEMRLRINVLVAEKQELATKFEEQKLLLQQMHTKVCELEKQMREMDALDDGTMPA